MQPVPVVIGQMSLFVPILLLREIMDLEYKAVCSECWKNKDRADVSRLFLQRRQGRQQKYFFVQRQNGT